MNWEKFWKYPERTIMLYQAFPYIFFFLNVRTITPAITDSQQFTANSFNTVVTVLVLAILSTEYPYVPVRTVPVQ